MDFGGLFRKEKDFCLMIVKTEKFVIFCFDFELKNVENVKTSLENVLIHEIKIIFIINLDYRKFMIEISAKKKRQLWRHF